MEKSPQNRYNVPITQSERRNKEDLIARNPFPTARNLLKRYNNITFRYLQQKIACSLAEIQPYAQENLKRSWDVVQAIERQLEDFEYEDKKSKTREAWSQVCTEIIYFRYNSSNSPSGVSARLLHKRKKVLSDVLEDVKHIRKNGEQNRIHNRFGLNRFFLEEIENILRPDTHLDMIPTIASKLTKQKIIYLADTFCIDPPEYPQSNKYMDVYSNMFDSMRIWSERDYFRLFKERLASAKIQYNGSIIHVFSQQECEILEFELKKYIIYSMVHNQLKKLLRREKRAFKSSSTTFFAMKKVINEFIE